MSYLISRVLRSFLKLLFKQTIPILFLLFSIGVAVALANMSILSNNLIRAQAEMNAELQANSVVSAWQVYSTSAADRVKKVKGISISPHYLLKEGAIPNPATYAIELGQYISRQQAGMTMHLYSDFPFAGREGGGPKDDFEQTALKYLREHPEEKSFSRPEEKDGRSLWRYGQAMIMEPSCVACHNTHPDSPKKNWAVGDVRGVIAVSQSLNSYTEKTQNSLKIAFFMLGSLSILGASGVSLVIGRLRQTARELEVRVTERTSDLAQANTDLEKRNSLIRQVFGRYLNDEIVSNLLESPDRLKLGGERRKITILTSDLRGFTAVSEQLRPEEVISILNIYLEDMANVVTEYNGYINEFMGDGILILFGVPTPVEDDATRAVACACAMQLAMVTVNKKLADLEFPQLDMGIGINTGLVILGNIGSEKHTKYGVVGSQVNLTYRIESYTTGGEILISDETLKAAGAIIQVGDRKQIQPKGVRQPITVHKIDGIGGAYNLYLPRDEEIFFPLSERIPIQFSLIEEKHVSETTIQGSLVELSNKGAKIFMHNSADVSLPSVQTNIKLNFIDPELPPELREDIYAKVFETTAGESSFSIHFTARPPAIKARLDRLYQTIKA